MSRACEYFHTRLILEDFEDIKNSGQAIFAVEPHDILPLSIFAFNDKLNGIPGHKCLGCITSFCFNIPFMRHLYTWVNSTSVDKKNFISLIESGISPVMCPGGVQEVTLMESDKECVLYLNSRFGFIKLALQYGIPIVPAFTFGQRKSYTSWVPKNKFIINIGRKIGFMPLLFFGLWGLPFAPALPVDYTVVVGTSIKLPKIADPSHSEVQKYHALYISKLSALYEANKAKYDMGDVSLRIV